MNPILLPVDGSECSLRALDVATEFAEQLHAEIVLCHVVDLGEAATMSGGEAQLVGGCLELLRSEGKDVLERAVARIARRVPVSSRILDGAPVDQIERLADEIAPSLIIIGSHGRSGFKRLVMGSVAEGVARAAPVPVMVVPPHAKFP